MNLFEYIKSQLPQMPNVAIMKQLGASQELIDYVKETTWNTNLGMMETLGYKNTEPVSDVWADSGEGVDIYFAVPSDGESEYGRNYKNFANWNDLIVNHQEYTVTVRCGNSTEINVPWTERGLGNRWHTGGDVYATIAPIDSESIRVVAGGDSFVEIVVTHK